MLACPACGKENPEGFRFCGFCTAPLGEALSPAEERKIVTVLFCDLVDFTSRFDRADPEDVRALLRPYHTRLRQEIERYGGTVEKFIGDAVMAVFGAPVAHEDDAERTVRTALVLLEAIAELNASLPGLDLAVRTGVATGEVLVSLGAKPQEGESIVAGDVVNLAARLQQEAAPGTVIVEEVCYRATKHLIDYEELAPVRVKGKADPLLVWRALRARSRFGVHVEEPVTRFVGRQRDLALLQDNYRRVIAGGGTQLVTIVGEPGVGKTRLLLELGKWVDARDELTWWRQGRCLSYGEGITFWALGEVVKAHVGILESDNLEEAEMKLVAAVKAVVGEESEQEWIRSRLAPLVGTKAVESAGGGDRDESFTAWRRFLEGIAAIRPLVILFEDIHWADEEMLQFIEHVADWGTQLPILILCTARPEVFQRVPEWGGGKKNSATIALLPLSEKETAELITDLLSEAGLPAEVQSALLERSGGNPLYAEQFARMLLDRGVHGGPGQILELASGEDIPVPETVQALIAARLDLLSPELKSVLQNASVVGKVFWSGAVEFMSGDDEQEVLEVLHELARAEFIRSDRRSSMQDQAEYSFWHILVRDVVYGQIPRAIRGRKHRAAAQWIERRSGERVGEYSEILAVHYTYAMELARAAESEEYRDELREGAIRSFLLAGDRLTELDNVKARDYYRRALELLPDSHVTRPTVLMKIAHSDEDGGRFDAAEAGYRGALSEYQTRGDLQGAAEAMLELADFLWEHGGLRGSDEAIVEEAIAILESRPAGRGIALAYLLRSRALWHVTGREEERLVWADRGLSLAREIHAKDLLVRALGYRAFARVRLGDTQRGLEEGYEALRLAVSLGLGAETARLYSNMANLIGENDPAAGLELVREGIKFADRRGISDFAMFMRANLVADLLNLGQWDEALRLADIVAGSSVDPWTRRVALRRTALMLLLRGDVPHAASITSELLSDVRHGAPENQLVDVLELSAHLEWRRGRVSSALSLVDEIERLGVEISAWDLLELLPILCRTGSNDRARRLLGAAIAPTSLGQQHALATARAIVAEGEGRLEEGARLYEEASKRWGEFGYVSDRAEALIGAGRCLVELGRMTEATEELREARDILQPLAANLLIGEIDELLNRVAAPSP